MATRFDELFSPDRLRQHWEAPPTPAPVVDGPALAIRAQYRDLLALLDGRYPGEAALRFPRETLATLFDQAFPPEGGAAGIKQREAIAAELESLEETLWALDLAKVRR